MKARLFPATPTAQLFTLAMVCDVAYDFGLEDALCQNPPRPEVLFPPAPEGHPAANAAYWNGYWAGVSLYYSLTGQRLFTCAYDSLEEVTYYD